MRLKLGAIDIKDIYINERIPNAKKGEIYLRISKSQISKFKKEDVSKATGVLELTVGDLLELRKII